MGGVELHRQEILQIRHQPFCSASRCSAARQSQNQRGVTTRRRPLRLAHHRGDACGDRGVRTTHCAIFLRNVQPAMEELHL